MGEPTKPEIREAFLKAMNRGDTDTAAKIAIYSVLTPETADVFACSLIAVAESILMAREDNFQEEDLTYTLEGIDRACKKIEVVLSPDNRKLLEGINLKWVARERTLFDFHICDMCPVTRDGARRGILRWVWL